jgi:hypothetical protein
VEFVYHQGIQLRGKEPLMAADAAAGAFFGPSSSGPPRILPRSMVASI